MSEEKLSNFLKAGKEWSRLGTTVPGVFMLKLPKFKTAPPRLAVELNPVDETGKPKKRRGLILRSNAELEDFKELFQPEKLSKLLNMIEAANPEVAVAERKKREEVLRMRASIHMRRQGHMVLQQEEHGMRRGGG